MTLLSRFSRLQLANSAKVSSMYNHRIMYPTTSKKSTLSLSFSSSSYHYGEALSTQSPSKSKAKVKSLSPSRRTTTRIDNDDKENDTVVAESTFSRKDLPDETIFIIDGTSLIFKSYFSQISNNYFENAKLSKQLTEKLMNEYKYQHKDNSDSNTDNNNINLEIDESTKEIDCSHLITLASQFVQLIDLLKPRYLVVVFDAGGKTFRNHLFPSYKQQRPSKPADMDILFLLAPRIFEIFGCRCIKQAEYEADDVMATLGEWAHQKGLNAVHVSPDKDMMQCVSPGIHVMNPRTRAYLGTDDVIRRTDGIPPSQLCDLWALTGDVADNIPGVKGVGDKVGVALIKYFGSIEEMKRKLNLKTTIMTSTAVVAADKQMDALSSSSSLEPAEPTYTALEDRHAVAELTKALQGVRCSKDKVWEALKAACIGDQIALYKDLVTLRKNVPITTPIGLGFEKFVKFNQTAFTPKKIPLPTVMNDSNININTSSSSSSSSTSIYSSGSSSSSISIHSKDITHFEINTSSSSSLRKSTQTSTSSTFSSAFLESITTSHYRYRGERAEEPSLTVQHVNEISSSLMIPLKSLRYVYRKLDREI